LLDVEDERDDDAAARDAERDGDKEDGGEGEVIPRLPDCRRMGAKKQLGTRVL
jgi:hypothetical protein